MAAVDFSGPGPWLPVAPLFNAVGFGNQVIDATGEKFAWIGKVRTPNRGSKDIRRVGFFFGTVTKAGGSALTVSLQNVDLANGPVLRPDGTQDQTVAIANADGSFVSNTWIRTGTLSADRTVTHGEDLAVVVEYDGSGRLGADSVAIQYLNASATRQFPAMALFTASWAGVSAFQNLVLEFSDGTFGTLDGELPVFNTTTLTQTFASNSTPDERALKFRVPAACEIDGAFVHADIDANADLCLYEGTTLVATLATLDVNVRVGNFAGMYQVTFAPIALSAATDYYLALKPTTTTSVILTVFTVADANHFQAAAGGTDWHYAARTDAGAWTPTTTKRPLMGIRLSAIDDGAGGSDSDRAATLINGALVQ